MSSAYLAEMCVNYFGADFFRGARIQCKYVASTLRQRDHHDLRRRPREDAEGRGFRFKVEIWAENDEGERKTVGFVEVDVGVQT